MSGAKESQGSSASRDRVQREDNDRDSRSEARSKTSARSDLQKNKQPRSRSRSKERPSKKQEDKERDTPLRKEGYTDQDATKARGTRSGRSKAVDNDTPASRAPPFNHFPGQYDSPQTPQGGASNIHNQFPGQVSADHSHSAFERYGKTVDEGGFGLAADYYNDHGESAASQPGAVPGTASPGLLSSQSAFAPSSSGQYYAPPSSEGFPTMAALGAAGVAASVYTAEHSSHGFDQSISANDTYIRERQGPLDRLFDLVQDVEDVQKMEAYTEYIGVCRYCFDPRSSARDAPRRHHYHRRRSSDSFRRRLSSDSIRASARKSSKAGGVRKDHRYRSSSSSSSSDAGGRRRTNLAWLGAGLAAYGLGKVGNALWKSRNDFDDTYSVQSGQKGGFTEAEVQSSKTHLEPIDGGAIASSSRLGFVEDVSMATSTSTFIATEQKSRNSIKVVDAIQETSSTRRPERFAARRRSSGTSRDSDPSLGQIFGITASATKKETSRRQPGNRNRLRKHAAQASVSVSSSESDGELQSSSSRARPGPRRKRRDSKDDLDATLLGLGATAAAIAAVRAGRRPRHEMLAVRERKDKRAAEKGRKQSAEDDEWESASDSEASSVLSALAFGDATYDSNNSSISRSSSKERTNRPSDDAGKAVYRPGPTPLRPTELDPIIPVAAVSSPPPLAQPEPVRPINLASVESLEVTPMQDLDPMPLTESPSPTLASKRLPSRETRSDTRESRSHVSESKSDQRRAGSGRGAVVATGLAAAAVGAFVAGRSRRGKDEPGVRFDLGPEREPRRRDSRYDGRHDYRRQSERQSRQAYDIVDSDHPGYDEDRRQAEPGRIGGTLPETDRYGVGEPMRHESAQPVESGQYRARVSRLEQQQAELDALIAEKQRELAAHHARRLGHIPARAAPVEQQQADMDALIADRRGELAAFEGRETDQYPVGKNPPVSSLDTGKSAGNAFPPVYAIMDFGESDPDVGYERSPLSPSSRVQSPAEEQREIPIAGNEQRQIASNEQRQNQRKEHDADEVIADMKERYARDEATHDDFYTQLVSDKQEASNDDDDEARRAAAIKAWVPNADVHIAQVMHANDYRQLDFSKHIALDKSHVPPLSLIAPTPAVSAAVSSRGEMSPVSVPTDFAEMSGREHERTDSNETGPTAEMIEDIARQAAAQVPRPGRFYVSPFATSVLDSEPGGLERGFVEGEVEEPTPMAEEREFMPDFDHSRGVSSREYGAGAKRAGKLGDPRTVVGEDTPEGPSSTTVEIDEPAWEPPLSKKERKRTDKAGRKGESGEDYADQKEVSRAAPGRTTTAPPMLEDSPWEPPLSKKELKKREKLARRTTFDTEETPEPVIAYAQPDEPSRDQNEGQEPVVESPPIKKGLKKRDKLARQPTLDTEKKKDASADALPPAVDADELDWGTPLSKKDRKKLEKAKLKRQSLPPLDVEEYAGADANTFQTRSGGQAVLDGGGGVRHSKTGFADVAALMVAGGVTAAALSGSKDETVPRPSGTSLEARDVVDDGPEQRAKASSEDAQDQSFLDRRAEGVELRPLLDETPSGPSPAPRMAELGPAPTAHVPARSLQEVGDAVSPAPVSMANPGEAERTSTSTSPARTLATTDSNEHAQTPTTPSRHPFETPRRQPLLPPRPSSSTSVPIRFRRFPVSPSTGGSPAGPRDRADSLDHHDAGPPLSPPQARHARPRSIEIRREFQPLYLVEHNRKQSADAAATDEEEALPPLPRSEQSSRSGSLRGGGEGYESAVEALEPDGGDVLGSNVSTPRAGVFPEDAHRKRSPVGPDLFYSWEDVLREERIREDARAAEGHGAEAVESRTDMDLARGGGADALPPSSADAWAESVREPADADALEPSEADHGMLETAESAGGFGADESTPASAFVTPLERPEPDFEVGLSKKERKRLEEKRKREEEKRLEEEKLKRREDRKKRERKEKEDKEREEKQREEEKREDRRRERKEREAKEAEEKDKEEKRREEKRRDREAKEAEEKEKEEKRREEKKRERKEREEKEKEDKRREEKEREEKRRERREREEKEREEKKREEKKRKEDKKLAKKGKTARKSEDQEEEQEEQQEEQDTAIEITSIDAVDEPHRTDAQSSAGDPADSEAAGSELRDDAREVSRDDLAGRKGDQVVPQKHQHTDDGILGPLAVAAAAAGVALLARPAESSASQARRPDQSRPRNTFEEDDNVPRPEAISAEPSAATSSVVDKEITSKENDGARDLEDAALESPEAAADDKWLQSSAKGSKKKSKKSRGTKINLWADEKPAQTPGPSTLNEEVRSEPIPPRDRAADFADSGSTEPAVEDGSAAMPAEPERKDRKVKDIKINFWDDEKPAQLPEALSAQDGEAGQETPKAEIQAAPAKRFVGTAEDRIAESTESRPTAAAVDDEWPAVPAKASKKAKRGRGTKIDLWADDEPAQPPSQYMQEDPPEPVADRAVEEISRGESPSSTRESRRPAPDPEQTVVSKNDVDDPRGSVPERPTVRFAKEEAVGSAQDVADDTAPAVDELTGKGASVNTDDRPAASGASKIRSAAMAEADISPKRLSKAERKLAKKKGKKLDYWNVADNDDEMEVAAPEVATEPQDLPDAEEPPVVVDKPPAAVEEASSSITSTRREAKDEAVVEGEPAGQPPARSVHSASDVTEVVAPKKLSKAERKLAKKKGKKSDYWDVADEETTAATTEPVDAKELDSPPTIPVNQGQREETPLDNEESSKNYWGLVTGAVAGAAVGLLAANAKSDKAREGEQRKIEEPPVPATDDSKNNVDTLAVLWSADDLVADESDRVARPRTSPPYAPESNAQDDSTIRRHVSSSTNVEQAKILETPATPGETQLGSESSELSPVHDQVMGDSDRIARSTASERQAIGPSVDHDVRSADKYAGLWSADELVTDESDRLARPGTPPREVDQRNDDRVAAETTSTSASRAAEAPPANSSIRLSDEFHPRSANDAGPAAPELPSQPSTTKSSGALWGAEDVVRDESARLAGDSDQLDDTIQASRASGPLWGAEDVARDESARLATDRKPDEITAASDKNIEADTLSLQRRETTDEPTQPAEDEWQFPVTIKKSKKDKKKGKKGQQLFEEPTPKEAPREVDPLADLGAVPLPEESGPSHTEGLGTIESAERDEILVASQQNQHSFSQDVSNDNAATPVAGQKPETLDADQVWGYLSGKKSKKDEKKSKSKRTSLAPAGYLNQRTEDSEARSEDITTAKREATLTTPRPQDYPVEPVADADTFQETPSAADAITSAGDVHEEPQIDPVVQPFEKAEWTWPLPSKSKEFETRQAANDIDDEADVPKEPIDIRDATSAQRLPLPGYPDNRAPQVDEFESSALPLSQSPIRKPDAGPEVEILPAALLGSARVEAQDAKWGTGKSAAVKTGGLGDWNIDPLLDSHSETPDEMWARLTKKKKGSKKSKRSSAIATAAAENMTDQSTGLSASARPRDLAFELEQSPGPGVEAAAMVPAIAQESGVVRQDQDLFKQESRSIDSQHQESGITRIRDSPTREIETGIRFSRVSSNDMTGVMGVEHLPLVPTAELLEDEGQPLLSRRATPILVNRDTAAAEQDRGFVTQDDRHSAEVAEEQAFEEYRGQTTADADVDEVESVPAFFIKPSKKDKKKDKKEKRVKQAAYDNNDGNDSKRNSTIDSDKAERLSVANAAGDPGHPHPDNAIDDVAPPVAPPSVGPRELRFSRPLSNFDWAEDVEATAGTKEDSRQGLSEGQEEQVQAVGVQAQDYTTADAGIGGLIAGAVLTGASLERPEDDRNAKEPRPEVARKLSKKEKRKAKKDKSFAWDEVEQEEPQPLPAEGAGEARVSSPRVETFNDAAVDTPATTTPTQEGDDEHGEIKRSPHDIDFAATLAAGLEHSGFDSSVVLDDANFHRRSSPPGTFAEVEPEETFPLIGKKNKKSKKGVPKEGFGDGDDRAAEDRKDDRDTEHKEQPNNDFDAVIAAGLGAAGFAAAAQLLNRSQEELGKPGEVDEESRFALPRKPRKKDKKKGNAVSEADLYATEVEGASLEERRIDERPRHDDKVNADDSALLGDQSDGAVESRDPEKEQEDEWALPSKKKGKKGKGKTGIPPPAPSPPAKLERAVSETLTPSSGKKGKKSKKKVVAFDWNAETAEVKPKDYAQAEEEQQPFRANPLQGHLHTSEVSQNLPTPVLPRRIDDEQVLRSQEDDIAAEEQAGKDAGVHTSPSWSFHNIDNEGNRNIGGDDAISPDTVVQDQIRDSGYETIGTRSRRASGDPVGEPLIEEVDPDREDGGSVASWEQWEDPTKKSKPARGSAGDAGTTPPREEAATKNRASYLFQSPLAMDPKRPTMPTRAVTFDQVQLPKSPATSHMPADYTPVESAVRKRSKAENDIGRTDEIAKTARTFTSNVPEQKIVHERGGSNSMPKDISTDLPSPSKQSHFQSLRSPSGVSNASTSSLHRLKTLDGQHRRIPSITASIVSNESTTPSLRHASLSGDLRDISRRGEAGAGAGAGSGADADLNRTSAVNNDNNNNNNIAANPPYRLPPTPPPQDDDRPINRTLAGVMAVGVLEGMGGGDPMSTSPTRAPSMRRQQSIQIGDLEAKINALVAENDRLRNVTGDGTGGQDGDSRTRLLEKDAQINQIRAMLEPLQEEIKHLTEVNVNLGEANKNLVADTNERYATLQEENSIAHQHLQQSSRELERPRHEHGLLSNGMESIVREHIDSALEDKDTEIVRLRTELDIATSQIRELQAQIRASTSNDFLTLRDEDYFDAACRRLCREMQTWVLRFSKSSDDRACRLTSDIKDEKLETRLDNCLLDGSDVDPLLVDRVRRRDIFMALAMTMVWEYIFTRYLFGMDREQRQKLKALEKILLEVGPARAVAQWRATTLTLLSQRPAFATQRDLDHEAVTAEIYSTLATLLPPPKSDEAKLQSGLKKALRTAIDLAIEMRTQRADYFMLPPPMPEYDAHGELMGQTRFEAHTMNERSGEYDSNAGLAEAGATVKIVLFPLVMKKGDDAGEGGEETVICPAQVLVVNRQLHGGGRAGSLKARSLGLLGGSEARSESRTSLDAGTEGGYV